VKYSRVTALVAAVVLGATVSAGAVTTVTIGDPGPPVKGVEINTATALAGPHCDAEAKVIKIVYLTRPPCVEPFAGGDNGGSTSPGVTADSIKVVVYLPTDEEVAQGSPTTRPMNRATGAVGTIADSVEDMLAVFEHGEWETYGRTIDVELFTRTGGDEAAQRADAVEIIAKEPFYVADLVTGGAPVFDAQIAGAKIIVQSQAGTNEDAETQSPYRWIGGADPNGAPINAGEFAKKSLVGKKAQFGGDDVQSKTRKFGVLYPETGVDVQLFLDQLPANSYTTATYQVPVNSADIANEVQQQAGTIIAKMKDDGVTTVVLFGPYQAAAPLAASSTQQDFVPEWFLPGSLGVDVSVAMRTVDQEQWSHAFGIGQLFPPVVGETLNQNTAYFDWYWGPDQGTYGSTAVSAWAILFRGVMFAGAKLTPKTFRQGMFSIPATGGAATASTQNYMTAYGPSAGLPYDEYASLGYDYYMFWWDPDNVGVSNIVAAEGTGRYAYLNDAKRYAVGTWPKGEPKFFDASASIYEQVASAPGPGQGALPAVDTLPDYPCDGCPSRAAR
jgi:hypothetical protein